MVGGPAARWIKERRLAIGWQSGRTMESRRKRERHSSPALHISPKLAASFRALVLLFLVLPADAATPHPTDTRQLARGILQNELRAEENDHSLWCYRELTRGQGNEWLFAYCQTNAGALHRLLAVNGRPLDQRQREAEQQRIRKVVQDPEEVRQSQKTVEADVRQERELLAMLPDAFLYREVAHWGDFMKLEFTPNPGFHPSGMTAHVLTHLQGTMVLDVKQRRLVNIEGSLCSEVKFWGGLLGRIERGGTFAVSMQQVSPQYRELKSVVVNMRGKALIFKTIGVEENKTYSDYTPVPPDTTLAQAAELLFKRD